MGTKFLVVVCDEHGSGGSSEYCGDNDVYFGPLLPYFTMKPWAASTFPARCFSTSSPVRWAL
jgi:hypothetical protein